MLNEKVNDRNEMIINRLQSITDKNKYLRLGQLISNALRTKYGSMSFDPGKLELELFYIDDDKLLSILEEFLLKCAKEDLER